MTDPRSGSWSFSDVLLLLLILGVAVWAGRIPYQPPDPVGSEAPDTAFSAARAMEHLGVIARAPHVPGSPEHERVREYLLGELRSLGLETEYQTTTMVRGARGARTSVAVWNVVGRLAGMNSSGAVLLMAHYDPVPLAPGASDDGTGVAAILEGLRAIRAGPPLANDLIVLFSDAEELGLFGARAFVEEHRWFPDVSVVLNLEMKGNAGASLMFETGRNNGWVVRAFAEGDARPVGNSVSLAAYRSMPNDTDYSPFRDAGIQGLNFSSVGGPNAYHMTLDNLGNSSQPTLQHHGLHALSMARFLGNADLSETEGPEVAFITLPGLGFICYPLVLHWLAILAAVGLAMAVLVSGKRKGAFRVSGAFVGLGVGAFALLVSGLLGLALFRGVTGYHPEYGLLSGSSFHREGWYFLALWVLGGAVVAGCTGAVSRRFGLVEVAWGGGLIPLGLAGVLAWASPLAAVVLVWPVLFGEGALLWFACQEESRVGDGRGSLSRMGSMVVLGLLLAPVVIFLVPTTEVFLNAMSISMAPALAATAALAFLLMVPALGVVSGPRSWLLPSLGGLLAILFWGLGLSNAGAAPDRPTPTSLFYAMDLESGVSWWGSRLEPAEPWIQARVPSGTSREMEGVFSGLRAFTGPADPVEVTPPTVGFQATEEPGVFRMTIISNIGAERLALRLEEDMEAALVAVNGRRAYAPGGRPSGGFPLTHWGDSGGPLTVDFTLPDGAEAVEFRLWESNYRTGEFLGEEAFRRPQHLIPLKLWPGDVAVFGSRHHFTPWILP